MSGYGVGAVISPTGNITYPWWCFGGDWWGSSVDCRVPSDADIRAAQQIGIGPTMTPANVQAALEAGDVAVAAYKRLHPEEAADYEEHVNPTNWPLLIGSGIVVVLILTR